MRILKYILSTWILIVPALISAQSVLRLDDMNVQDSSSMKFGIRSEGFVNSSALSARASNAGFFGGYITAEQRQFMLDRSGSENNAGEFLNNSIYFARRVDSLFGKEKSKLSFFVNISDRQEANSVFSKNTLSLLLFGNKQFAGDTVGFAPLGINQFRYNQLQVGLNKTFQNDVRFGFGVSFLYGQNNQSGYAKTFDLYTSSIGDSINGFGDLYFNQTDPNNGNSFAYNGAGVSIDIDATFPINLSHRILKDAQFTIGIYDLGFINWHGSSIRYDLKSDFEFDGVRVDNIFDAQSNEEDLGDYLDSLLNKETRSYTSIVPFTIQFELKQEFENSETAFGIMYRHNAFYRPFLYGKYGHNIGEYWKIIAQLNYGGYGKFGGGLEINHQGKNIDVSVGATNVEGFLNPDKWAGQSLYVLLGFKL